MGHVRINRRWMCVLPFRLSPTSSSFSASKEASAKWVLVIIRCCLLRISRRSANDKRMLLYLLTQLYYSLNTYTRHPLVRSVMRVHPVQLPLTVPLDRSFCLIWTTQKVSLSLTLSVVGFERPSIVDISRLCGITRAAATRKKTIYLSI